MIGILDKLDPTVLDAIGVAGFGLYVLNYTLLTFRRIKTECVLYFVINGTAASMVLVGLSSSFNLASAMIQIFWVGISIVAIIIRLRSKPQGPVHGELQF
jgi:hypothetical protein